MKLNLKKSVIACVAGATTTLAAVAAFAFLTHSASAFAAAPASAASASPAASLSHHGPFTGTKQAKTITSTAVISVVAGSPAAQAGLQAGDVILSIDGQNITSTKTLADILDGKNPGDAVALQMQDANGATRTVNATLGDNPNKPGTAYLGITYGWPRGDKGFGRGFGRKGGVAAGPAVVANVQAGSPAAQAGLQAGDVINQVNGQAVDNASAVKTVIAASKPGDKLTLQITRGSQSQTIEATLGENPNQAGVAYLGVVVGGGRRAPTPSTSGGSS